MRVIKLALGFLLGFAVPAAMARTTLIDLDTDPGHYSTWQVTDISESSVSFKATFLELKKHKKWQPTYTVELGDKQGNSINFKGAYVGPLFVSSATLSNGDGETSNESVLKFTLKQQIAVSLSWGNGVLHVTSNEVTQDYQVGFNPTELKISCSTGNLEVRDITFK